MFLLTLIFCILYLNTTTEGVAIQDGIYLKITCLKDGQPCSQARYRNHTEIHGLNAMTVDSEGFSPGANITASAWKRADSQKWLAMKDGDNYILLPRRQHRLFAAFLASRKSSGSSNKFPSVTVVLGIDNTNGAITQQLFHGKSNQQWQFNDAKQGRVLIKSPLRGKCIREKELEKVELSFIQKASMKFKDIFSNAKDNSTIIMPKMLQAEDCDENDTSQVWIIEPST